MCRSLLLALLAFSHHVTAVPPIVIIVTAPLLIRRHRPTAKLLQQDAQDTRIPIYSPANSAMDNSASNLSKV